MSGRPIIALSAVLVLVLSAPASAFHDGGVGTCYSCHTMHVSRDGGPLYHWNPEGNPYLLLYGNATDTCLMCHSFNGVFDHGEGWGPGGDFSWVNKDFSWTTPWGTTEFSPGDSHGHNVMSGVFDIDVDATLETAPGGVFQSNELGCTSCHDPHGNANFRMLYDSVQGPLYLTSRFDFTADAPLAKGNSHVTSIGSGGAESDANHTIYKSGMSAWCGNCHEALHRDGASDFIHPTGEILTAETIATYNSYVSTADLVSGDQTTSYMGLVPFEAVDVDLSLADPTNATAGPGAGDQVMCLTCHRAHASPFADAGRWDFRATYLVEDSHPQITDTGATAQDVANRYYGYTFIAGQRSLCNKCHAKDRFDAAP